ncbi:MAG: DNA-directed RNA polymerase subunit alpha [Candidatus Tectomicrobia bacterium]|uniref:DNA-directed RNA polymerase subunit alpha n=1 Tax=Tectimicrobiota bacterium TaxID=2528274 RepID=A0A933LQH3_UNCTE|nr:DNA-directed RNA polymerase subunit alpha [Candidatus Tectomicrobia bacterium]
MKGVGQIFQKPKRLECEESSLTSTYGKFTAEPFERGFGVTLGNSLRRVLLSSLPGAAVTAVQIEGVYHEFSTIPGVVEDVTDIILNLKEIRVRLDDAGPKKIYLHAEGEKTVTAKDIETGAGVEILNPGQHIATLNKEGKLNMEMIVRTGRGYLPAERNEEDVFSPQMIPIDAIFSPIKKVNFKVENTRVGRSTDYDRLILEITTDGSIIPEESVAQAARILKEHVQIFINFEEKHEAEEPEKISEEKSKILTNLNRSVEELELSVRSYNCLKNANIKTIAELVQKTEAEMLKTRNFGRKSLNEIKEILTEMGLSLGMKLDDFNLDQPVEEKAED